VKIHEEQKVDIFMDNVDSKYAKAPAKKLPTMLEKCYAIVEKQNSNEAYYAAHKKREPQRNQSQNLQ